MQYRNKTNKLDSGPSALFHDFIPDGSDGFLDESYKLFISKKLWAIDCDFYKLILQPNNDFF